MRFLDDSFLNIAVENRCSKFDRELARELQDRRDK